MGWQRCRIDALPDETQNPERNPGRRPIEANPTGTIQPTAERGPIKLRSSLFGEVVFVRVVHARESGQGPGFFPRSIAADREL